MTARLHMNFRKLTPRPAPPRLVMIGRGLGRLDYYMEELVFRKTALQSRLEASS